MTSPRNPSWDSTADRALPAVGPYKKIVYRWHHLEDPPQGWMNTWIWQKIVKMMVEQKIKSCRLLKYYTLLCCFSCLETYFTTFHSTLSRIFFSNLSSHLKNLMSLVFSILSSSHSWAFHWSSPRLSLNLAKCKGRSLSWPFAECWLDVDPSVHHLEIQKIPSMGRKVYFPTWMVDFYGVHVGKYTSPMDTMGYRFPLKFTPMVTSGKSIGWILFYYRFDTFRT